MVGPGDMLRVDRSFGFRGPSKGGWGVFFALVKAFLSAVALNDMAAIARSQAFAKGGV